VNLPPGVNLHSKRSGGDARNRDRDGQQAADAELRMSHRLLLSNE
jgi:hypothetical protein